MGAFQRKVKRLFVPDGARRAFSQEGEDLLLERLLDQRSPGVYVDVGAHHPTRYSNTYRFYQRGWRGVNVDAWPGSMRAFNRLRPHDANIESGVGSTEGALEFFCFNQPALNTFDPAVAQERAAIDRYFIEEKVEVPVRRLEDILGEHLPSGSFDFLSVDVEGRDLDVLESNDWVQFRPQWVLVECLENFGEIPAEDDSLRSFLAAHGYRLAAKAAFTSFFRTDDYTGRANK